MIAPERTAWRLHVSAALALEAAGAASTAAGALTQFVTGHLPYISYLPAYMQTALAKSFLKEVSLYTQ